MIYAVIDTDGLYLARTSGKEAFPDESDREFYEHKESETLSFGIPCGFSF